MHNFGNAGSQTSPRTQPTNESSSSSDGDTDDSDSDERNDIECTYRANEAGANELDASSADSGDSDTDKSNDIEDNNDNFPEDDNDEDEAEKTVEDYIREMTDETFRTEIGYDPKRVLKYMSWARHPRLTPIQQEAIRFLRCASFGHGSSKAHANAWLAYQRAFGGRAALLPKSIDTVWSVMAAAHRNMSDAIMRKTVVLPIPFEVRFEYISHTHLFHVHFNMLVHIYICMSICNAFIYIFITEVPFACPLLMNIPNVHL